MKYILVVTATLGNRDTLARTIESVRKIGGDRVKHVIVCPEKVIPKLKENYDDLDFLAEPEGKKGIYAALNHGFNTYGHDYPYMTFINDDDYWLPDYALLIKAMLEDEQLDMVYGRTRYVDEYNHVIGSQTSCSRFSDFAKLLHRGIVMLTQQSTLIKSELYFKVGGFDESFKLVSDSKFWAQLSVLGIKYKYINKECAAYMIQDRQLSSDHALQAKETSVYLRDFPCSKFSSALSAVRFRMENIPLYIRRIIKKRTFKNPFSGGVKMLVILLPWPIKRFVLRHMYGYNISPSAYIGFSYVFPKYLEMADGAKIGSLNVAIHLDRFIMGENSSVSRGNWITGFPTETDSKHFSHDRERVSELVIGRESAITKNHHIDCTNSIHIGDFVTIAGYNSQFLTHSIDVYESRQDSHPIYIGNYCFISTNVIVLGGAELPAYSVLAAGAVLNKKYDKEWTLYGEVPAIPIKTITKDAKYFNRKSGYVF